MKKRTVITLIACFLVTGGSYGTYYYVTKEDQPPLEEKTSVNEEVVVEHKTDDKLETTEKEVTQDTESTKEKVDVVVTQPGKVVKQPTIVDRVVEKVKEVVVHVPPQPTSSKVEHTKHDDGKKVVVEEKKEVEKVVTPSKEVEKDKPSVEEAVKPPVEEKPVVEKPKEETVEKPQVEEEGLFDVQKDVLVGLRKEGKKQAKDTKAVVVPDGVKVIRKNALANLDLERIEIPSSVTLIEKGALDGNCLEELYVPNDTCEVQGISNKDAYVNVITPSLKVKDMAVKGGYGMVVNRSSLHILYTEEDGSLFKKVTKVSDTLEKRTSHDLDSYYRIGDEVTVKPVVSGYAEQYPHVVTLSDGVVEDTFAYRGGKIISEMLDPSLKQPQILGAKDRVRIKDEIYFGMDDLLEGVKAFDYQGNEITDRLEIVNASEIENTEAFDYPILYRVVDEEGNVKQKQVMMHIEQERKFYPYDFIYDGNVVMGLSDSGQQKLFDVFLAEEKVLNLPERNLNGQVVDTVGSLAFRDLDLLEVLIPNTYKEIGAKAFNSNKISKLVLPEGLEVIGQDAFSVNDLVSIRIPSTLRRIENRAFTSNYLHYIDIAEGVEEIGKEAFSMNFKLDGGKTKSITIPSSVKRIEDQAFLFCKFSDVILQEGLSYVGPAAFARNDLTRIEVPNSLTTLDASTFLENNPAGSIVQVETKDRANVNRLKSLGNFVIDGGIHEQHPYEEADFVLGADGVSFSEKGRQNARFNHDLIMPNTIDGSVVTKVKDDAFMFKKLTSITLPETITHIGTTAFASNALTSVTLPKECVEVAKDSFFGNPLETLVLSSKIQTIGKHAFYNCKLETVELPETIQTIGENAFKREDGKKVVLRIPANENTKAFVLANESRNDFVLEVIGEFETQQVEELVLDVDKMNAYRPTYDDVYGLKVNENLWVKVPKDATKETIVVKVNGNEVSASNLGMYTKGMLLIKKMRELVDLSQETQLVEVLFNDVVYQKKIKVYEAEPIALVSNDPNEYENGLRVVLKAGTKPHKNVKIRYNQFGVSEGVEFDEATNSFVIDARVVEVKKVENQFNVYVSSDYYVESMLEIPLVAKEEENTPSVFEGTNIPEEEGDVHVYTYVVNDESKFDDIKTGILDEALALQVGRSTFAFNEDKDNLYGEEFCVEVVDEEEKKIKIYINYDGNDYLYETLTMTCYGETIFEKSVGIAYELEEVE